MSVVLQDIGMQFPGALALDAVSVTFGFDEIHGLIGENGAGKSTLVNILGGSLIPTEGTIAIDGTRTTLAAPYDALAKGISHVSQEGSLVAELSGAANILLGDEPRLYGSIIKVGELTRKAEALLERWFPGVEIDLSRPAGDLAVADQKVIEIIRALRKDVRLIILDEPTATLQSREKERLWAIIRSLPTNGVGVVLISHFLSEILALCDRITVLQDGGLVRTLPASEATDTQLADLMLRRGGQGGVTVQNEGPGREVGAPVVTLSNWRADKFDVPEFEIRAGEIVGLIGLTGAGHFEFASSLYERTEKSGTLTLNDVAIKNKNIRIMQRAGVALVPDNRMINALSADGSIVENLSMVHPEYGTYRGSGILRADVEKTETMRVITALKIKTSGITELIRNLSGGNKQKVSLGKWLYGAEDRYKLMIFIEPTEGVDIGAKQEIYSQIRALAASGIGVLVAASDLFEIDQIADRVIPFVKGSAGKTIARPDFSEANFIAAMTGENL